ncbi:uncharacterized protein LOC130614410 [Hydractinia symbiolongicarpus]|uniref:uncharacterized protein LOC130614410 n=1 Tax=Hydractinia symbiolongicarpus TaxID=13093 RepID=UPI0025504CA1|nr:uncharacterized protein LOC130614410 [Hydractinia symbiolongicarpus]
MILIAVFLVATVIHEGYGKGYVEINLKSLSNPKHFDNGKECCDTWPWKTCRGECDTKLYLCVTDFNQPSSRISCNVGKLESKTFSGQSSIVFKNGDDLGKGVTNPMIFSFQKWQRFLEVMFTTYDVDTWPNPDDLIDILSVIVPVQASANSTSANVISKEIKGRVSSVKFDVKVYCDDKYKGKHCDVLKKN